MPDFVTMQGRIADEMARDDLAEHIRQSIYDSIGHFSNELTFANKYRDTSLVTVQGNPFVALPDTFIKLQGSVYLIADGSKYRLNDSYDNDALEEWDASSPTRTGRPSHVTVFNRSLRFWCTPDAAYPLIVLYRRFFPVPVNDGDGDDPADGSYFWMTTAERMIRAYAKKILYADVLKDHESADREEQEAMKAHSKVRERMVEQVLSAPLEPWDME